MSEHTEHRIEIFQMPPTDLVTMTLRDWFAGQALPEMLKRGHNNTYAAAFSYVVADAMLAEREKGAK